MKEQLDQRLVIVSNRLPFQLQEKNNKVSLKGSDGGLVSALKSYFDQQKSTSAYTEKWWIGSADFPEKRWEKFNLHQQDERAFQIEPIFVDTKVYNRYYNGFCNATLWPLFHYFPSFVEYDADTFDSYEQVNQLFADKLLQFLKPGDTLWIHDYQLMLLPGLIREKMPNISIGFFLHIPFPSYEIFRLLHRQWKEKIINGLLGADLIGFHTHEYVQHFLKSVRMIAGYDHQYRSVYLGNRTIKADLFPLGIDYDKFHNAIHDDEVIVLKDNINKNFIDKKVIFSVDRLDYTKGVTHRLSGFERFLETHPEWKEQVVFVLVVVPSRQIISKYNERRRLIEEQVGRINGKYSTLQWQPIIYRYSHLSFHELCALYQASDVGLITPLRDGMNLVAKEYIASRIAQRGVLILSELAGAASEMSEAILVNPLDKDEVANAINTALNLPLNEQQAKIKLLEKRLTEYTVVHWVNDFIKQLDEVKKIQQLQLTKYVTSSITHQIVSQFKNAQVRQLFLDYDGTLVPFARHPREAIPSSNLISLLESLTINPRNQITIISGRDSNVLDEWFNNMPVTLVAEHGASIRRVNQNWEHNSDIDQSWKVSVRPILELFTQRSAGSFVEEKNHTLAWHYRNVDSELGFTRSRELLDNLYHLIHNANLQIIDGNKVIEVRVAGIDKGSAARKLLQQSNPDFSLAIGDDKTDEDMFRALQDLAVTVKVGNGNTHAQYYLSSQKDVIHFLTQLID